MIERTITAAATKGQPTRPGKSEKTQHALDQDIGLVKLAYDIGLVKARLRHRTRQKT